MSEKKERIKKKRKDKEKNKGRKEDDKEMSDKQLMTMDKVQLLTIMRQQELEIERLSAEKAELAKCVAESTAPIEKAETMSESAMLASGIIETARRAADLYLKNITLIESEHKGGVELGYASDESKTLTELRIISYLYMNFIEQSHRVLHEVIERYKLTEMLPVSERKRAGEQR